VAPGRNPGRAAPRLARQQAALEQELRDGEHRRGAADTSRKPCGTRYKTSSTGRDNKLLAQGSASSLSEHRHALQPGQPCPLCGAHEHPAVAAYEALDASATEAALRRKQDELDALQTRGEAARHALAATTAAQAARQRQADELEQDIARWHDTWNDTWRGLMQPLRSRQTVGNRPTPSPHRPRPAPGSWTRRRAVRAARTKREQAATTEPRTPQHSRQTLQTAQGQLALRQQAGRPQRTPRRTLQQSIAGLGRRR
jgi:exonuclease SbcC